MKTLELRRIATGNQGTYAVLKYKDIPFSVTLEREWLDNRPSKGQKAGSCIPAGTYKCKRVDSPRFGNTFEVTNVPKRSHILFHKGNLDDDSRGCILVGEQFGKLGDSDGILSSKAGYDEFMFIMMNEEGFRLIVVDDFKTNLN